MMHATHRYIRQFISAISGVFLYSSFLCSPITYAQNTGDWPNKTIKVVVPYTPGGSTDTATRVIMDKLTTRLKQNIVIENKPGANGNVGAAAVARAEPDGYTFVSVLAAYSISPHLYQMPFAPDALVPISKMADLPLFLFVSNKLPVTTVQELVSYGKTIQANSTMPQVAQGRAPI